MKKKKISKILDILSAILTLVFVVKVVIDYITYKTALNSAPFYLWIIIDAIYFLVPVCVLEIIKMVFKRKRH